MSARDVVGSIAALYAVLGLIYIPFMLLVSATSPGDIGLFIVAIFLMPVLLGVFGFVFGAIFCWIYNQLAGWLGGFEVRLETR